jgi:pectate lyase
MQKLGRSRSVRYALQSIVFGACAALAGCAQPSSDGGTGTGGSTGTGGTGGSTTGHTGGSNGSGGATVGTGGSAPGTGGGSPGTGGGSPGAGGTTSGSGGSTSGTGGAAGKAGATGGTTGTGAVTGAGGAAGAKGTGGAAGGGAAGAKGTGGASTGGTIGTGGTFVPAWTCVVPTFPSPTGSPVSISSTKEISGTYDGKMALHDGSGSGDFGVDCNAAGMADQGTTKPLFELDDGATIENVIIDHHAADGIHCKGTCTVKNVWFRYVCDDAVTAESGSSGTVTIDGGGATGAHDKLFQDNSHGKFVIQNFYGERLGKMYRACGVGSGCTTAKGNLTLTNSVAIGVDEVVGLTSGRDTATISKLCIFQTPTVCQPYDSSDNPLATDGVDGTTCKYNWTDVQVMLNDSTDIGFTTAAACPNYLKSSSSTVAGTTCISNLTACVKPCAVGDYGIKQCNCSSTGAYTCGACNGPSQEPAKSGLDPSKATSAPACTGAKGDACSTEWNWCISGTQDCVCVFKPGTLQTANTVWDCANPWF